jgi:hypothetical protein
VLVQGTLLKAGEGKRSGNFRKRFVKLTNSHISYHVLPDAPAIDKIFFEDIVGVVCSKTADGSESAAGENLETCFRAIPDLVWEQQAATHLVLEARDFAVCTSRVGMHRGRHFHFRTPAILEKEQWLVSIGRILQRYNTRPVVPVSDLQRLRSLIRWFYIGDRCQIFIASLIMLNFTLNIVQACFASAPSDSPLSAVFGQLDLAFTVIFTTELAVNLFATLVRGFVCDIWNWSISKHRFQTSLSITAPSPAPPPSRPAAHSPLTPSLSPCSRPLLPPPLPS